MGRYGVIRCTVCREWHDRPGAKWLATKVPRITARQVPRLHARPAPSVGSRNHTIPARPAGPCSSRSRTSADTAPGGASSSLAATPPARTGTSLSTARRVPSSRQVTRAPYVGSATRNGLLVRRASRSSHRRARSRSNSPGPGADPRRRGPARRSRPPGRTPRRRRAVQPRGQGGDRQRQRPVQAPPEVGKEPRIRLQPRGSTVVVDLYARNDLPRPAPATDRGPDVDQRRLLVPVLEVNIETHHQDDRPTAASERSPIHHDGASRPRPSSRVASTRQARTVSDDCSTAAATAGVHCRCHTYASCGRERRA